MRPELKRLVNRALRQDRLALARLLSIIENSPRDAAVLIRAVYGRTGRAWKIGVTGPLGTGKSTFIGVLVEQLRGQGKCVAVLAVDPSSPLTRGALLGDRIRMARLNSNPGVFVRSMATRGQFGGISKASYDASIVLDAAGFDYIIVETIGAGQSDVAISRITHVVLLVTTHHLGDEIQALKAGLMEVADIIVLNKGDQPKSELALQQLRRMTVEQSSGWKPPVIKTVATVGEGIEDVLKAVEQHRSFILKRMGNNADAFFAMRELEQARTNLLQTRITAQQIGSYQEKLAKQIANRRIDPYSAAARLLRKLQAAGSPA